MPLSASGVRNDREISMNKKLKYTIFKTEMGWVGILASEQGLLGTTLPQSASQEAGMSLGDNLNEADRTPQLFEDLVERLKLYFRGHRTPFPDDLDLSAGTPFQREAWQTTALIPFGETRSYLWIASQMGKPGAARAVGQALGNNPLAIIVPCHRVVASDGGLGGFGGGLEMKQSLLRLEASSGTR